MINQEWLYKPMNFVEDFIKKESSAGIVLFFAAVLALIFSNSPLSGIYNAFLHTPVEIRFAALHIDYPLYMWINDGLMAIFFLLIGLEVKRELLEGSLSSIAQIALPGFAAVGGMVVPAACYLFFNLGDDIAARGWAIPAATDIAFALGILALLGKRVPISLKIFLLALAIIDDIGAIIIIALFYTADLSVSSIVVAVIALIILIIMNRMGVARKAAYIIVGVILWVSVLKSGVHATLAGVALAFCIPLNCKDAEGNKFSLLKTMEHGLHYWVAFFVLPIFAFVNAGIDIREVSTEQLLGPVPLGIMVGLFIGKQIGVFGFSFIAIKLKLASLPDNSNWLQLYGVSALTGVGFTMSLFITSLAFPDDAFYEYADRLAILAGSFASGTLGYLILRYARTEQQLEETHQVTNNVNS